MANLQPYPREGTSLLSSNSMYNVKVPCIPDDELITIVESAYQRCMKNKLGEIKPYFATPQSLVRSTLAHLKERSDPILSPYFLNLLQIEDIFELDAVSYEMQRHRMTIGIYYQYLILELMRKTWQVFDGSNERDIVADIETPGFDPGLRLYISVKKSQDTVGGQDISGVIRRLENEAKGEKNLNRPYLCVIAIATPSKGKLKGFNDRKVRLNRNDQPYSLNCEFWGPGFIFPFITGHEAFKIYKLSINNISRYLPFMTIEFKEECSYLLKNELIRMDLIGENNKLILRNF
jgi:hypothetical protein